MKSYLDIVKNVLDQGRPKKPVRFDSHVKSKDGKPQKVEHETIGLPNVWFDHDMTTGFPLLTTKQVPMRMIAVELEGFIKGITDKGWYQQRRCPIWDEWSNPQKIPEDIKGDVDRVKEFMLNNHDLGPIYGSQWRNFGGSGYDQFKTIADRLRENPYDRRMVCSAWAPHQIKEMALPPCHFCWNVVVYGDTLSLWWGQRSCDLMLGVPFNIASYALLLCLLAKHAGLRPWKLNGVLADCHIYEHMIKGAEEQVKREPRPLPDVRLPLFNVYYKSNFDIFKWNHEHLLVEGYSHHGKIDFGEVTVT